MMEEPKKSRIRRNQLPINPNRRPMTVNIMESYEELYKLNKKALKILAKRGL